LCLQAKIDEAIREDGSQIATLPDFPREARRKVKVYQNSSSQQLQQLRRLPPQIEERSERPDPLFAPSVSSVQVVIDGNAVNLIGCVDADSSLPDLSGVHLVQLWLASRPLLLYRMNLKKLNGGANSRSVAMRFKLRSGLRDENADARRLSSIERSLSNELLKQNRKKKVLDGDSTSREIARPAARAVSSGSAKSPR
jgi:hypothetical protein